MADQPAGHRVIVKQDPVEEVTRGGIILSKQGRESEQRNGFRGELVAVGPKAWCGWHDGEHWAKVGDRVVFARHSGTYLDEDQTLLLMNDEDILAVEEV